MLDRRIIGVYAHARRVMHAELAAHRQQYILEIEELRQELAMLREAYAALRAASLARNNAHEELAQLHRARAILNAEHATPDLSRKPH